MNAQSPKHMLSRAEGGQLGTSRRWATLSDKTGRIVPNPSSAVAIPPTFTPPQSIPPTLSMDSYDENEFQIPSTPPEPPAFHSDTVYQSGNPSQYRNLGEKFSDSDEYDDPSFMPSDEEEGEGFLDEFPSQLTEALLPLEAEQNQHKNKKQKNKKKRKRGEGSEDEDDGLFKDEFPKDLPAHPANFLWPDALPKEMETRDRPYPDTDIYPPQRPNPYDGILPTGFKDKKKKRTFKPKGFATPLRKELTKKKKKKQKRQKEDWESDNSDDESVDEEQKVADETWLNYNADEIELVNSLDIQEAQDLGAQLINAAGLKRSRWDYEKMMTGKVKDWHNKRRWQRDVPDSEEARQAFERDDTWGAWPLEPWNVPREGEKDAVDEFRWREKKSLMHAMDIGGDHYKPSREMEEVLTARGVKLAKESFEGRMWKVRDEITSDMEREEVEEFRENAIEMGLDPDEELERVKNEYDDVAESEETERTRFRWLRDRREPTVDADDERNEARMRAPVRHALARLDDLLLAMRKNRKAGDEVLAAKNGSQIASRSTSVASGYATDTTDGKPSAVSDKKSSEPKPKTKGKRGRPKKMHLRNIPEYKDGYTTEKIKGKRGRPKKVPIPQEGETQEEAIIRMHRQMKKKVPVFGLSSEVQQKIKDEPADEDVMVAGYSDVDDANATKGGNISPELIGYLEEQTMLEEAVPPQTRTGGNISPELIGTLEEQTMLEEAAAAQASQDFQELDQDDIKHSDSDDPVREEYIAAQYDNWPYPKEMWIHRMARRKAKKEAEEADHREWMMRYANRDWSEVLGMAAIIGFPPKVIQRTAQRLTGLLGEGIDLRVFQRLPDREASTLLTYRPEKIPSDDGLFGSTEEEEDVEEDEYEVEDSFNSTTSPKRSMSSIPHISKSKTNQDSDNSLSSSSDYSSSESELEGHTCPIEDCDRQMPGQEISTQKALRAHLRKRHDWSEYDIEEFYEETSDEDEMMGGILRDGFLKKIKSDDAHDRRGKKEGEKRQEMRFKSRISPEL